MSYILEALKRADSERGHNKAPDLYPSSAPHSVPDVLMSSPKKPKKWLVGFGFVALVVCIAAAWGLQRYFGAEPSVSINQAASPSNSTATAAVTVATPQATIATPHASPDQEQDQADSARTQAAMQDPQAISAPAQVLPILAQAPPPPPPRMPRAKPETAPTTALTPQAEAPASAQVETPPVSRTSTTARTNLPPVVVSGSSYSNNPDLRMLIVNGSVVKEGQTVSPGMTLEVIGPRSAVFNHQGVRFNVNY